MASIISHLEKRIKAIQQEFSEAQNVLVVAKDRVERLAGDLEGYLKTLAAERRQSGVTDREALSEVQLRPGGTCEKPTATVNGSDVNKSAFIRGFITSNPGSRPAEIHRALKEHKISVNRPYVYSVLNRAKARKIVIVRRGKYYPATQEEGTVD